MLEPKDTAVFLDHVIKQWCISMRLMKSNQEKESAFKGSCYMIPHNPQASLNAFPYICSAFVKGNLKVLG